MTKGEIPLCRLIALDVDGTLLNSRGEVSEETVRAIHEARRRGVRVVLSTGRSAPEAASFIRETGCDSLAVCLGGAAIMDADTGRHLRRWDMAPDAAAQVLAVLRGQPLACMVFAGEANVLDPYSNGYFHACYPYESYLSSVVEAPDIERYLRSHDLPLTKIHARGDPAVFPALRARLGRIPGLALTSSGPDNFEVVAAGVDKGKALCLLGREWDIRPEDIAAVGDSDNDLAMLRAVGWPVAMGNASDEVKRAARMVTDGNDGDGVAHAIFRLLGKSCPGRKTEN